MIVSTGQIPVILKRQRTPESALMFLVVVVVLPVEGLSRGDDRSKALSPQSLRVFLQLSACLQARDLISDVKTDKGNTHLLSFLEAYFMQAYTLKSSDTNC